MPLDNQDVSQRIDMILRIGFGAKPQGEFPDGSSLNKAQRFADSALTLLANFANTARDIRGDQTLSPIGRGQRLTKVGTEYIAKIEALRNQDNITPAITRKLSNAETIIANAINFPDSESVVNAIREGEIRSWLYTLDKSERHDVFRKIVKTRDFASLSAVVHAPRVRPIFTDPKIVEDGIAEIAESTVPVAVKDRDDAREALQAIDMIHKDMREMIAGVANLDFGPARGFAAFSTPTPRVVEGERTFTGAMA